MAKKKQWHPLFIELLRPLLGSHFEVETNMAVGDAPRLADLVLLRRRRAGQLPFQGLWRNLTAWNVLEFKGPTVSPRAEDIDDLVELGLGIHRRLNEERGRQGQPQLGPEEVSFWYLANRLGKRLLRAWGDRRLRGLQPHGPGIWRCEALGRLVFLVSGSDLPVEPDSLPLHLIGREPPETEQAVAQFLVKRTDLWERYSGYLMTLHTEAYEGVKDMAKTRASKFEPNLEPVIRLKGVKWLLEQVGVKRVVEQIGARRLIDEIGAQAFLDELTAEQRRQLKEYLQ